uniref:Uncharacterized protein n=1 Tax=Hydropuntia rangiferina TaxID=338881 RepID=A0A345U8H5_9FLOR|nr:hypothetical protein [Hydropuntia rangiferina]AXI96761.1 hypothetical protein [Hydropuntia rangiferina]
MELLSCVDKAAKIKTNQLNIDFDSEEEIDKLMGKVARTKSRLFEDNNLSPSNSNSLTEPNNNINLKQE